MVVIKGRRKNGETIAERFNPRDTMEWHQWIARFNQPKHNDKEIRVVVKNMRGRIVEDKRVPVAGLAFEPGYRHDLFDL
jgi:hypothetical protein